MGKTPVLHRIVRFVFLSTFFFGLILNASAQKLFDSQIHLENNVNSSQFVVVDWNEDGYDDALVFTISRSIWTQGLELKLLLNDGNGGIGEIRRNGYVSDWRGFVAVDRDGASPQEFLVAFSQKIQSVVIQDDLSITYGRTVYTGNQIESLKTFDVDGDGTNDVFIVKETLDDETEPTIRAFRLSDDGNQFVLDESFLVSSIPSLGLQYQKITDSSYLPFEISGPVSERSLSWGRIVNGGYVPDVLLYGPIYGGVPVDWNGDGTDDLLASGGYKDGFLILRGVPDGGFVTGYHSPNEIPDMPENRWPTGGDIVEGDLNEDGVVDRIQLDSPQSHPIAVQARVDIQFGKGSGREPADYGWSLGLSDGFSTHLFLYDFDGDGHLDLLYTDMRGPHLLYYGKGDGTFEEPAAMGSFSNSYTIPQMGDFNGDNIPDLLAIASAPDYSVTPEVYIALGIRNGLFGESKPFLYFHPTFKQWGLFIYPASDIQIGDVNGDGCDDIWFGGEESNLWINTFKQQQTQIGEWELHP